MDYILNFLYMYKIIDQCLHFYKSNSKRNCAIPKPHTLHYENATLTTGGKVATDQLFIMYLGVGLGESEDVVNEVLVLSLIVVKISIYV